MGMVTYLPHRLLSESKEVTHTKCLEQYSGFAAGIIVVAEDRSYGRQGLLVVMVG